MVTELVLDLESQDYQYFTDVEELISKIDLECANLTHFNVWLHEDGSAFCLNAIGNAELGYFICMQLGSWAAAVVPLGPENAETYVEFNTAQDACAPLEMLLTPEQTKTCIRDFCVFEKPTDLVEWMPLRVARKKYEYLS